MPTPAPRCGAEGSGGVECCFRRDRFVGPTGASPIADDNFADRVDDDTKDGSGFGFDAGAMVTIPVLLEPTFGATILNISDTDLGDAGELPQQVNLGVSISHSFSWVTLVGAADWVDVTDDVGADDDLYKRLHFGLEGRLAKILSLRAGLNQGYGTFGATLDFKALKLDYATYAEEIGSTWYSSAWAGNLRRPLDSGS